MRLLTDKSATWQQIVATEAGLITDSLFLSPGRWFMPPNLVNTSCVSYNGLFAGANTNQLQGAAIGFSKGESVSSTIGEFCERYCSALPPSQNEVILASYAELRASKLLAMVPSSISLYAANQYASSGFPYEPFKDTDEVLWVRGKNLDTGLDVYVPAFLVYLPHNNQVDKGRVFCQQTSTGIAAGRSVDEAILSGLSEGIERHDFARFWYGQRLYLDTVPCLSTTFLLDQLSHNAQAVQLLSNHRVKIKVFDLGGLSCMETMVAFLLFPYKGKVMMSMGAATRFTKEAAVLKAVLEAYQGIEYCIQLEKREGDWTTHQPDFSDVDSFHRHFAFYNRFPQYRSQVPILDRIFTRDTDDYWSNSPIPKVRTMADWPTNGYQNAVWVDLTSPDVAAIGYHVVRTIVPGLAYLTGSHHIPFLGAPDFQTYPDLFTSLPHPFP